MTHSMRINVSAPMPSACQLTLLDEQDQAVGLAQGEFRQHSQWYQGQKYFFLESIRIFQPDHRQQGLGSYLLKAVERLARQQGAQCIRGQFAYHPTGYSSTREAESTLTVFWRKHGYSLQREVHDNSLRIWKPLTSSAQAAAVRSHKARPVTFG